MERGSREKVLSLQFALMCYNEMHPFLYLISMWLKPISREVPQNRTSMGFSKGHCYSVVTCMASFKCYLSGVNQTPVVAIFGQQVTKSLIKLI